MITLKKQEAEELAREVAVLKNKPITAALREALHLQSSLIIFEEPDAWVFVEHLRNASLLRMGAPTLLEASMAVTRRFGIAGIHSVQK